MTSEALTAPIIRADGRTPDQLRPISITRGWSKQAEGSALIEFGNTRVLCTASLTEGVPALAQGRGPRLGHRRVRHAAARHEHPLRP